MGSTCWAWESQGPSPRQTVQEQTQGSPVQKPDTLGAWGREAWEGAPQEGSPRSSLKAAVHPHPFRPGEASSVSAY